MGIEPSHRPQQETDGRGQLLIGHHLDLGKASGIVDGDMGFLKARATAGSKTPISGHRVADGVKAVQSLGVEMDHVDGVGPVVRANRLGRLQISWPTETQGFEQPAHAGEWC